MILVLQQVQKYREKDKLERQKSHLKDRAVNLCLWSRHDCLSTFVAFCDKVQIAVFWLELLQLDLLVRWWAWLCFFLIIGAQLSFKRAHKFQVFARRVDDSDEGDGRDSEKNFGRILNKGFTQEQPYAKSRIESNSWAWIDWSKPSRRVFDPSCKWRNLHRWSKYPFRRWKSWCLSSQARKINNCTLPWFQNLENSPSGTKICLRSSYKGAPWNSSSSTK